MPFSDAALESLQAHAQELAKWRDDGCPGYGFAAAFQARTRKAAQKVNVAPGVFFTEVHRLHEAMRSGVGSDAS